MNFRARHEHLETLELLRLTFSQLLPTLPSTVNWVSTRAQNERQFSQWHELRDGGRRYSYNVGGRHGWRARYVKEVESDERTIRFYQEVYDENGKLVEVHEKYPVDNGHKKV